MHMKQLTLTEESTESFYMEIPYFFAAEIMKNGEPVERVNGQVMADPDLALYITLEKVVDVVKEDKHLKGTDYDDVFVTAFNRI